MNTVKREGKASVRKDKRRCILWPKRRGEVCMLQNFMGYSKEI